MARSRKQSKAIENMLGRHSISKHDFDIYSEVDPSLRLSENVAAIKKMVGIDRVKSKKELRGEESDTLINQCMRTESKRDCKPCCEVVDDDECCDIVKEREKEQRGVIKVTPTFPVRKTKPRRKKNSDGFGAGIVWW